MLQRNCDTGKNNNKLRGIVGFIPARSGSISEPTLSSEKFAKVCFCLDPNNVRVELVEILFNKKL
tara:strand:+ start:146 stop:340 length:195 start_codon:yes stop_codon:yes gene_type:complete